LRVKIPAGISDGSQIRLSGEGDAGLNGGSPGNLYVLITVQPHPFFQRQDDDLIYDLDLNVAQAALGCQVEIPTLEDGHRQLPLKVPAGTQSGHIFVMKGKGVPHLHGQGRGDLLVRVKVMVPTELTGEQRRLLAELAKSLGTPVTSDGDKGVFGKIKDAFA